MSPTIALNLCIFFVLWLLYLERKQSSNVSFALWIPTIWLLYIASKPLAIWFGYAGDPDEGSLLDRNFLSALLCLNLIILVWRRFNWSSAIKKNIWLMLLLGYMLISILWSDIPFISLKRWIKELIAVSMAFLVLTEQEPKQAMESVLRRSVYILIPFSLLLIKYFPYYGVEFARWSGIKMWVGVTTQKNGLGRLCIISAFFLIWSLVKKWQGHSISGGKYQPYVEVLMLIMTLWLMIGLPGSYSATAIGAFTVALSSFIVLLWTKKFQINLSANILTVIMALIIGLGIITVFAGGSTLEDFTSTLGRDETLTGRTKVWAQLLPVAMHKPIFGHGIGGFWTPASREFYNISEGHSGYLDVLLTLGFFGLLLVSIFLLSSCRKAQRELDHDFDWASLWICYLLMAVVHNITESSINSFSSQLTAVLMFLVVSSSASTSYTPGISSELSHTAT